MQVIEPNDLIPGRYRTCAKLYRPINRFLSQIGFSSEPILSQCLLDGIDDLRLPALCSKPSEQFTTRYCCWFFATLDGRYDVGQFLMAMGAVLINSHLYSPRVV
jgi:hypothetical protein